MKSHIIQLILNQHFFSSGKHIKKTKIYIFFICIALIQITFRWKYSLFFYQSSTYNIKISTKISLKSIIFSDDHDLVIFAFILIIFTCEKTTTFFLIYHVENANTSSHFDFIDKSRISYLCSDHSDPRFRRISVKHIDRIFLHCPKSHQMSRRQISERFDYVLIYSYFHDKFHIRYFIFCDHSITESSAPKLFINMQIIIVIFDHPISKIKNHVPEIPRAMYR